MMDDLKKWLGEQHAWVTLAVNKLEEKSDLEQSDFKELFALCCKQAKEEKIEKQNLNLGVSSLPKTKNLRITKISDIENINALSPKKPLDFGDENLCVIYGPNGSGKSGYVRLLKHLTGSKYKGELLGNINNKDEAPQRATVEYKIDSSEGLKKWQKNNGSVDEIMSVDIYDSKVGEILISKENSNSRSKND